MDLLKKAFLVFLVGATAVSAGAAAVKIFHEQAQPPAVLANDGAGAATSTVGVGPQRQKLSSPLPVATPSSTSATTPPLRYSVRGVAGDDDGALDDN